MTLAESLRREGEIRGEIKGLSDAIELGMTLRFPDKVDAVMAGVKKINNIGVLVKIKEAIKTVKDGSGILLLTEYLLK